MKTLTYALAGLAMLGIAGCENMTPGQKSAAGAVGGTAAGLLVADAFDANPEWTVVSALAGAAAGTLVARHQTDENCAYARGDGTYYTAPCQ